MPGVNGAPFAAERHQVLCVAALAAHPQEAVPQSAAFEITLELLLDIPRHYPAALLHQMGTEYLVMLFDNPIEKGLLGTVAPVTTRTPLPGGRPGRRRVGHDPHPCDNSYCCDVHVHDPVADREEAKEEYGVTLESLEELPKAQAVVLAVAHKAYRNMGVQDFASLMAPDALLLDVKSTLDREQFAQKGIEVWRLYKRGGCGSGLLAAN